MKIHVARVSRRRTSPWSNARPIREEFFGDERLAQHAGSLARAQKVLPGAASGPSLATRLKDNADHLLKAYRNTVAADARG